MVMELIRATSRKGGFSFLTGIAYIGATPAGLLAGTPRAKPRSLAVCGAGGKFPNPLAKQTPLQRIAPCF
jgi:hypothetical protein